MIPLIRKELEDSDGSLIAAAVAKGDSFDISIESEIISLEPEDVLVETSSAEGYACGEDSGFLTALDTTLNDALISEGIARELIRTVQDARKQAGLDVSDRIILGISGSEGVESALLQYRDYLMSETLAIKWQVNQVDPLYKGSKELEIEQWSIEFSKVG